MKSFVISLPNTSSTFNRSDFIYGLMQTCFLPGNAFLSFILCLYFDSFMCMQCVFDLKMDYLQRKSPTSFKFICKSVQQIRTVTEHLSTVNTQ